VTGAATSAVDRIVGCLDVIAAGSSDWMGWQRARDQVFIGLQQIRQYDVSCQQDIGQNLSSGDSTLTNRRENARFWLRKRIWETCDMAMYTSGRD